MRRVSFAVLLAMIASLFVVPVTPAAAATFRNFVAQVPANPGTGSVRVWVNSDTALGETAGVEYNIGSSFVKVLGTFDTSYPGANWRADIPGQPAGTFVRYQLFTRNQSGQDYGFTGFNWSYTTSGAQCAGAVVGDNNVFYSGLFHDSFSAQYRSPLGPVSANQGAVTLRFRTCASDVQEVTLRVWNDRANQETLYTLAPDGTATDPNVGPVQLWKLDLPVAGQPTILYYTFRASDGTATGYYRDDDPKFLGGGFGQAEASRSVAEDNSYQISVFSPSFFTPEWMQRAVIYQIFPDRFRDGKSANNPPAGSFSYGRSGGTIVRSNGTAWNTTVCDPRERQGAPYDCKDYYGDNFYGGDLKGITEKLEDGYFSSLGVTLLYLNPIFRAPSNHKYDTANFMEIDPDFGTLAEFQAMVAAANARGIRVMLDGVFNHTSSDSPYFDRYGRYAANGTINDADGGTLDGSGACEAVSAQYRSWFYFEGDPNTTIFNPGGDGGTVVRCADASGNFTRSYEAWYGYSSLPKIRSGLSTVRDYFYGSAGAVGPYWTQQGAAGWRFDVGADVDPGLTNDPGNNYWEGFRAAVRNPALSGRSDTVMLGEEWGDGSPWLLGDEWDSVMNYRFRSAALGWMFTGCQGNGCTNGSKFQENDSNDNSSSGAIFYLSPSQFNARLRSIHEDYPANAFKSMMNLAGSHDTQRLRFLLKKINNDSDGAAVQRMKEWWLFAFTYAGAPTLYYGDEVGLSHDGVWDGSQYQDDPYNRAPFPWNDTPGAYVADTANLQAFARHMASVRQSYRALQDGDVQHGLVIDDAKQLYGFARTNGQQTALVLLNRGGSSQSATFSGLDAAPYNLPNGTTLVDAISGATYTVSGGAVTVNVTPAWGAVLLEQSKVETPAAPALSAAGSGADVALSWPMVTSDSAGGVEVANSYKVYRNGALLATVANPAFGGDPGYTDAGAAMGGYSYSVSACNAAGKCSTSASVTPTKQAASLSVSPASAVYGGSVTFTATLSAGSANLAGRTVSFTLNGQPAGTATTNSQGVATLAMSLGSIGAGEYSGGVAASFGGDNAYNAANGSATLTVAKATAVVTLSGLSQTYDGGAKSASATTSPAGLTVSFSYTQGGQPVAAPTDAGSYAVAASVVDANYEGGATGALVIAKAAATLTLTNLAQAYTGAPRPVDVVTAPADLSGVSVTYDGATTAPSNAGSYAVVATLANPNYAATPATGTLTIVVADQTISFAPLADKTYGDAAFMVSATASSGLPVSFSVGATDNCTISGGTVTITGAGSCSVAASQAGSSNFGPAPDVTRSFTIAKALATVTLGDLTQTYDGSEKSATATTTPAGLSVGFSYSATPVDAGSYGVTATVNDANYQGSASGTLVIGKAGQTISFAPLADKAYGDASFGVSATASSGLPVSLAAAGSCSITASTVTIDGAGSCTITASQGGDNNYSAAASVARSFTIAKALATITLSDLSRVYTGQPQGANVTTSPAGLTVNVTYNGSATEPTNAGSYAVAATVVDDNYQGGASGSLAISKADQTIALSGVPASGTAGQSFTVSANATSGLTVSLGVSGQCSLSGANVTLTAAGSCTVTATQAGGTNYNAAAPVSAAVAISAAPTTFPFSGFFAPVNNPPTVNVAKAGSAIPVKFSLGGNRGLNIFANGYPAVVAIACPSSAPTDPIADAETTPATANSLSYDAASGRYNFVWKTDKGWSGTCRQLVLKFSDGTTKTATFNFTR